jgi:hypothetical protein
VVPVPTDESDVSPVVPPVTTERFRQAVEQSPETGCPAPPWPLPVQAGTTGPSMTNEAISTCRRRAIRQGYGLRFADAAEALIPAE